MVISECMQSKNKSNYITVPDTAEFSRTWVGTEKD